MMVPDMLKRLFDEIQNEANHNPSFQRRLELALKASGSTEGPDELSPSRRNRRAHGILDPFEELQKIGERGLRERLADLSIDQLKDIVSEEAMDSSRLALKWRSAGRLIELIVTTAQSRLKKGDAFNS
jgi:hypothetical protein